MKTRNGFVSNSSSSSFCIMGVVVAQDVADKIKANKETTLEAKWGIADYYEQNLAGFSVSEMKDDETLAQFKARCQAELAKFDITEKVEWCVDGGSDS